MNTATQITSDAKAHTILVIGASGKTGRRVTERLRNANIAVKAASRSSETRFDWDDQATWEPAISGATGAYITVYPDLSFPGVADRVQAFAELAVANGCKRLVLLSGRGEEGALDSENRLRASGADWTIVRCSVFSQNFSESFQDAIRHGFLSMPVGDILEPFIDADDIAEVASAAFLDDRHVGQVYELSGPRLLSMQDVVHDLSDALGREVQFQSVSVEAYAEELEQHGFPKEESLPVAQLIADVLDGRNAYLADGVQRALGREAKDFADFARDAAAEGIWDLEEVQA
ncbi:SDR family oxidoreductase [Pelagicoccus albus]|uniref:NAD(P)H-binding protein n=1 Tax=Pelagicoccus albus TaxID=415222 RepID=A0A7X1E6W2_9BACT|nr:NmrA family NAD(P)-binding protein [Pelagicoccus albus]MBC2604551.1 NAD(P)H-binding protein [Pelagicoccus albus]